MFNGLLCLSFIDFEGALGAGSAETSYSNKVISPE